MMDHTLEKYSPKSDTWVSGMGKAIRYGKNRLELQIHLLLSSFLICMLMFILEYNLNLLVNIYIYIIAHK